jgi:hypothetical protein
MFFKVELWSYVVISKVEQGLSRFIVTSTTVPIYDQTPLNNINYVVPEPLWEEPKEGSKHNE